MVKRTFSMLVLACICWISTSAQRLSPEEYIELYKDFAIREMKRMGVPAAITLAQGLLETESGNSSLVRKSNNHFGIKCKSTWTSGGVSHDDDAPGECFRSYKDAEDSYRDHSNFLRGSERYAFLFNLDPSDYKAWAHGLKKAGYATNPKYPNILIRSIEQYNLQQYSVSAAKEVPKFESKKFQNDPEVVFATNQKIEGDYQAQQAVSREVASTGVVTKINGNKCIWAETGTSLLAIASQHNVNLRKLLDYNDLEEDGILDAPQLIFLERKAEKGEKQFEVIRKKTTYYDIAQENGVQLQSVLDYNQVNEDAELSAGTKVYLQPVAETDQAKAIQASASNRSARTYEVKAKDGLYSVAKKHSVTVQQLREWNNLSSDNLQIGQQLIVSQ
ncbi:MAG: glucosaminidase domain-containing protein [Bacteroidota bacterium]